ncbi:MAG: iron-regulated protein [Polyangiaceae bacterium]|nr:iron-regulated protein [Polyangiaceae bacterium]
MVDFRFPSRFAGALVVFATTGLLVGCGPDAVSGPPPLAESAPKVINGYADVVFATYTDALEGANAIDTTLGALVTNPSDTTLGAARTTWLEARNAYGQSEAFRFYGGPIDDDDGPEGRINAWPMDESYVDYVDADPAAGIINDSMTYPTIDGPLLTSLNEKDGEKNISTGYHAIEFLLWGQDKNASGPGARPFTDYVVGAGGTASNQQRRGDYLLATGKLLIADLKPVADEWADGGAYRASFVQLAPEEALRRILLGIGSLSGAELAGERMQVAYDTKEQEDEHSCFSDNTIADILNNARGIQNVYLGKYKDLDVPGLDELVRERDAALDKRMQEELSASIAAIEAIPAPFDQAILGDDSSEGRMRVDAAIKALRKQTTTIVEIATLLGISLNIEE